jgi:hypothetical protein
MNWLLVSGAGILTAVILGALAVTASALMEPPEKQNETGSSKPESVKRPAPTPSRQDRPATPSSPTQRLPSAPRSKPQVEGRPVPSEAAPTPACETYGTGVKFHASPADAARAALRDHKLMFVLHISGHFEDSQFT